MSRASSFLLDGDLVFPDFNIGREDREPEDSDAVNLMSRSPQQQKHQQGSLVDFFAFETEETGTGAAPAADFVDYAENGGADIENAPPSEEVQRMPEHYYHEVESFLSRPAPQFGEGPLRHLKVSNNAKSTTVNNLLASTMSKRKVSTDSSAAVVANAKAKVNSQPQRRKFGAPMAIQPPAIDERLLREAFAYTDKLVQEDDGEEEVAGVRVGAKSGFSSEQEKHNRGMLEERRALPNSAPSRISAAYAEIKPMRSGKSQKGLVKKLRSQTKDVSAVARQPFSQDVEFSTSSDTKGVEVLSTVKKLDFDALVTNFEQGLTLRKLQQELSDSQNTIAQSNNFLRQLTKEFGPSVAKRRPSGDR